MTNPDALAGVVARVTTYLDTVRAFVKRDDACEMQDEPGYFATLDHADLRTLLAALAEAQASLAHQRQVAEDAEVRLMAINARLAAANLHMGSSIFRSRTPQPETPE